ncbi:MAG: radical SAM protein, partial [Calditrichia bacterium]
MTPTEKSYVNPVFSGQDLQVRKPLAGDVAITAKLDSLTVEGELYRKLKNGQVHCYSCGHNCIIRPGGRGICQVRFNSGGKLFVPWGYVAALHIDPIEKKPFYHVYPGSDALTFGMLGCDLHCPYCQNWDISQTLRDKYAGHPPNKIPPEQIIEYAKRSGAKTVVSSYNEPLITSEWAAAIFKLANNAGFDCLYVSNGNGTKEVLEYLKPLMTGYKIDLKSMNDKNYRKLGCPLKTVLETISMAYR